MKHILDPLDLSITETDELLEMARHMMDRPGDYADCCKGKILATLFYEPSTRTRLSFESAMLSLGGSVLGFSSSESSSATKGEGVADTIRTVSCYADICAMRHAKEGAALLAAQYTGIPVINAGDGGHQHPTQTFTDLFTILTTKQRLTDLTIGICGDLMFGRTVHSLIKALSRYPRNHFILVSPAELKTPGYIIDSLKEKGIPFHEVESLEDTIGQMDILYMTRVQRERFFNEEDYVRLKDTYILDKQKLTAAKEDLAILHPLPRVNEIAFEVDNDPRARYFYQMKCGRFVRMALIKMLLEVPECSV